MKLIQLNSNLSTNLCGFAQGKANGQGGALGQSMGSGNAAAKGNEFGIGVAGGKLGRTIQAYEIQSIQQPVSPRRLGSKT